MAKDDYSTGILKNLFSEFVVESVMDAVFHVNHVGEFSRRHRQ